MRLYLWTLFAVIVSGCAAANTMPRSSGAPENSGVRAHATQFRSLFSFNGYDGTFPEAELLVSGGKLYGTTYQGGLNHAGVVFELDPASGRQRVVYSFKGGTNDGRGPYTGLVELNGVLYGDTTAGGNGGCAVYGYPAGCGTIFAVTKTGQEHVVYKFKGGTDGSTPQATLLAYDGKLYGTAIAGGAAPGCKLSSGCGVVFEVTPSGHERVLYRFSGGADGGSPIASLTLFNGQLYSVTLWGGTGTGCYASGCGTAYAVSLSGQQQVVYDFQGGSDAASPWANLVPIDGVFYGTTLGGAANDAGTIFSLTPTGQETILHQFADGALGTNPKATLTSYRENLYGVASSGGRAESGCARNDVAPGCGVIFELTPAGAYTVLHRFRGIDGASPQGTLVQYGGALYGTTFTGGRYEAGTIFRLTP